MTRSILDAAASMQSLSSDEIDLISGGFSSANELHPTNDTVYCKYDSSGNTEYCWTQKNDCP